MNLPMDEQAENKKDDDDNTEPFNFEMNKRYSDFLWLKKMLSLIYVNCVVPPLCKKNFSDRFTDYLIEKRMRSIEKFMDGILEHPLLRNSEIVKDFLSMVNSREYNKKIEKYNKIKKSPAFVRQIKTMSGEVNIGINNEKEIYFDNIKNYVKGHYILLQKITKGYKSIMNIMQQLSNKMKDLSKIWKQVFDISIKYSDSCNTSGTYNIMSKLMEDWSEIQKSQMNVINRDIREYFRYVKNEFNGLKEMTERVQNSKSVYIKFKEKLQKTKETLFEKQDPETWQLKDEDKQNVVNLLKNKELAFSRMLPQDTLKLKEYKQFYGCLLNSLIAEFERIRKINNRRHKENTVKFVRELSAEITNLHVTLADRQCEFHELKDDTEDYNKIGGGFIKQVEKIEENVDEKDNNNNSINENNKEIIEDNNIDKLENSNTINNHIENNSINNHVENNNIINNNIMLVKTSVAYSKMCFQHTASHIFILKHLDTLCSLIKEISVYLKEQIFKRIPAFDLTYKSPYFFNLRIMSHKFITNIFHTHFIRIAQILPTLFSAVFFLLVNCLLKFTYTYFVQISDPFQLFTIL